MDRTRSSPLFTSSPRLPLAIKPAMDLLLTPLHHLISKPARRAYLQTILLLTTSITLLFIAVLSYLFFYASYVPTIGTVRPLHFSYAPTANPTASVLFSQGDLLPEQPYKITLHLKMPASPRNIEQWNFNCDLTLSPSSPGDEPLLRTRRPGILTYRTPLLTTLRTLAFSPLLISGISRQEETLHIPLAESAVFALEPRTAKVEVSRGVAVYEASLEFVASLGGLRWAMYHWRLTTFVVFVGLFWAVEVVAAGVGWLLVSGWLERIGAVKVEEGEERGEEEEQGEKFEVVDTQRTYPRATGAPAYPTPEGTPAPEGPEGVGESGGSREGDDEDEFSEDERVPDSGLGTTTLSESTARERIESMRRRRKRESGGSAR